MRVWEFANGQSFRELALYQDDQTALAGSKRRFRDAQPGERMTLIRKGGEVVFTLERPRALASA